MTEPYTFFRTTFTPEGRKTVQITLTGAEADAMRAKHAAEAAECERIKAITDRMLSHKEGL